MNKAIDDRQLLRLLHGELGAAEAAELRQRLRTDAELRLRWQELESTWQELELAPLSPLPAGWRQQVVVAARRSEASWNWAAAPLWVRAAATVALLAGVLLGNVVAGPAVWVGGGAVDNDPDNDAELLRQLLDSPGLAESYWQVLAEDPPLGAEKDSP